MKTYIIALTVSAIVALSIVTNYSPKEVKNNVEFSYPALLDFESPIIEEEAYVNDIPFNTEEVFNNVMWQLEEEEYVDDIPFDTEEVVRNLK